MASQPVKRSMVARLCEIANPDLLDLPPETSPDELATAYVVAYLEGGGRLSTLLNQLQVARWTFNRWLYANPDRKSRVTHARTLGADALVDEGGDLLDKADRDTIAVANARAGWRKWLASKYDPTTYGDKQQGGITVGALHLHAALPLPSVQSPPLNGSFDHVGDVGYPTATKQLPSGNIVVDPPENDTVGLG